MKVKELIEALKGFDPELEVCRAGYEGGYAFVTNVKPKELILGVHEEWWYGPHEDVEEAKQYPNAIEPEEYSNAKRAWAIFIG